jgi:hypothetical protein
MTDFDQQIRAELNLRADQAPQGADLLAAVHRRSGQLARRRKLAILGGTSTALAGLTALTVLGAMLSPGGHHNTPPAGLSSSNTASATTSTTSPHPSGSATGSEAATAGASTSASNQLLMGTAVNLQGTFPLQLATATAAEYSSPVVTQEQGVLLAFYLAKDPQRGADITLAVTEGRPSFASAAGQVTETSTGCAATPVTCVRSR